MSEYVVVWTSGFEDRRPLYFQENGGGWNCTENREEATRYSNKETAVRAWLDKHAHPARYIEAIASGRVRVETIEQTEFAL